MKKNSNILIIGAGLSGLTLTYLLSKKNIEATILEASLRLGGRIQTLKGDLDTPLEIGATWFSEMHRHLISLLDELEIEKFKQFSVGKSLFQTNSFEPAQEFYVPSNESPSYRINGGTQVLIDALAKQLDSKNIKLGKKVISIKELESKLLIETSQSETFNADKVVLCLPPQLVSSQIKFLPKLPEAISMVMPAVQTWMAGSIKFAIEYAAPFWRHNGYSGMLFSHSGIIREMHDHTNAEENKFGFTGFLNGSASTYLPKIRKQHVLQQLQELLGAEALNATAYYDKVWTDEFILNENQIIQRPHQNNGHPLLQESYMNGKLFFSGTETSPNFSGYMEGAIRSVETLFNKILN